jgi:hypothetical protein
MTSLYLFQKFVINFSCEFHLHLIWKGVHIILLKTAYSFMLGDHILNITSIWTRIILKTHFWKLIAISWFCIWFHCLIYYFQKIFFLQNWFIFFMISMVNNFWLIIVWAYCKLIYWICKHIHMAIAIIVFFYWFGLALIRFILSILYFYCFSRIIFYFIYNILGFQIFLFFILLFILIILILIILS